HPSPIAAYRAALIINDVLGSLVSPGVTFDTDPTKANLIGAARLTGVNGTKGEGIAGQVATNWKAAITSGFAGIPALSKVIASTETIGQVPEKQVFLIEPVNDSSPTPYHRLEFTLDDDVAFEQVGLADGDWLQAAVYVETSSWSGWADLSMQLQLRH